MLEVPPLPLLALLSLDELGLLLQAADNDAPSRKTAQTARNEGAGILR
jgi:hypothetical protein